MLPLVVTGISQKRISLVSSSLQTFEIIRRITVNNRESFGIGGTGTENERKYDSMKRLPATATFSLQKYLLLQAVICLSLPPLVTFFFSNKSIVTTDGNSKTTIKWLNGFQFIVDFCTNQIKSRKQHGIFWYRGHWRRKWRRWRRN